MSYFHEDQPLEKRRRTQPLGQKFGRAGGLLALSGALFCGYECWSHFNRAADLVQEVRQASVYHPPVRLDPQQAAILQAVELETERTVLVGEETAMRDYGIGCFVLFAVGGYSVELSLYSQYLAELQPPAGQPPAKSA
jgi:hypothetical protein